MKIERGHFKFEIPDDWIKEANFTPMNYHALHYKVDSSQPQETIMLIDIDSIYPKIRNETTPIFNDGEVNGKKMTAKERTVSILSAINNDVSLPPVEVLQYEGNDKYMYKLKAGCRRFYCSIAAGFKQIPAIYGFDPNL